MAAFEVYNIGYGMAEEVYQQSLEIELELASRSRPAELIVLTMLLDSCPTNRLVV